ncbi:hypothetical protein AB6A40_005255 [Gnathostoma spinigerum]|uniref:N(6)-L-threonylcarbamoyladenine synthase n=1 Tax=Gnathostoma spinigerum TaxID=75299 RepID=A0ABD6EFT6_9BILA
MVFFFVMNVAYRLWSEGHPLRHTISFTFGLMKSHIRRKVTVVLGIETSCDDTAVAVVSSERRILSERRYADRSVQTRLGGICPSVSAAQHRSLIGRFVKECVEESGIRLSDLDAIAVSTRPGLVICLKVGIHKALSLSREGRIPLIPVHHMQAHATVSSFFDPSIAYPYIVVLVSGAHALLALCRGPDRFDLFASSESGSPGECLDKIGRELGVQNDTEFSQMHAGAAIENLAKRKTNNGHLRYPIRMPSAKRANFHFAVIRCSYSNMLSRIAKDDINIPDFCASVQHTIAVHLASKLFHLLDYFDDAGQIPYISPSIVVSGGVAANKCVVDAIGKVGGHFGLRVFAVPLQYCSDNAVMVAWNGIQLLNAKSESVVNSHLIPPFIFAEGRSPIGRDCSEMVPLRPRRRISMKSIAEHQIRLFKARRSWQ